LRAYAYETLANYHFDKNEYKTAGAYFDSTMTNLLENSKPFRVIKKKRENLDDVIKYEGIAQANDSILRLVAMSPIERETYFAEHIEKLKLAAEKEKLAREKQEYNAGLKTADIQKDARQSRNLPNANPS